MPTKTKKRRCRLCKRITGSRRDGICSTCKSIRDRVKRWEENRKKGN